MQKFVRDYLNELTRRKKKNKRVVIAVVLLAVIVIGGVGGILERYGVAMTGRPKCGIEEHEHNEDCYEKILVCGQEEGSAHEHGEGCYETEVSLTCGQEEGGGHTHDDSCYETETTSTLTCGQEEGEDHTHDGSCYEEETTSTLTCDQEEGGGHTHDDSCYTETKALVCEEDETPHVHSDACYEEELVCEKEEHQHDDSCYTDPEEEPGDIAEEVEIIEEEEENIEEDPEQWEKQYANVHWKDAWGKDLVTAAGKQLGYEEKTVTLKDGSEKIYTRYGQFAGDKYLENWDGAFVNFCMHFAGLEDAGIFTDETDAARWISEFKKESEENKDYLTSKEDYEPEAGDLVFLQEKGKAQQMGIVSSYNDEKGEIEVIQGDSDGKVEKNTYDETDSDIKTYVKISELEASYKDLPGTEEDESAGENELTEEEQAQVDEVIALIEDLPAREEIEKKFAELEEMEDEEACEKAYEAYYQKLVEQVAAAKEAYEALSEKQKAAVTNAEKLLEYEWLETATLEEEVSESKLKVSLLYGDKAEHPDGAEYYTHSTMSGYIKLEPSGLTEDMKDILVTLEIPKQYVEKDSVKIPGFTTTSPSTKYEITSVTEDDENYYISIDFSAYDKTLTLELPFALSFLDDKVPDNYELPVTASVTKKADDTVIDTAEPVIYKPLYKDWGITKFVNSNKIEAFQEDGAEAVVTAKDADGNPYLGDKDYVEFYFRVNRVTDSHADLADYRDASEVTLTDTLPSYTDKDGNTQIAKFDPEVNPGWTLSEDGKTVSKTYTGKDSTEVLRQIYNDAPLKLRFPDLLFEEVTVEKDNVTNVYKKAELDNTVDLLAIPSNEAEGETRPTAEDPLHFLITDDPSTDGSFTKTAEKGNIYDLENYKTNPYPWKLCLSNNGVQPLEHITIEDRKIVDEKTGKVTLAGLDEALKFVRLESDWSESFPASDKRFVSAVKEVEAYYTDGTTAKIPVNLDASGNFTVEFDPTKECNGYDIIFKDDFKLLTGEKVSFKAYTVYRDPEGTVVPDGTDKIRYENEARSVNIYNKLDGMPVYAFLTVRHGYDMLPVTEKLEIGKQTYANSGTENNKAGDKYRYWISLGGSLFEEKEYGKFYIVDLMPNEVDFVKVTHGAELFTGGGSRYPGIVTGVSATPEIEENYHNSGRTALIWELPYETLMMHLKSKENGLYYVVFQFEVQIREDAHTGTVRNDIYVVGDNLKDYSGETGGAIDIYDLDNDGKTTDKIAYSSSDAVIVAGSSIYAEKFIAPAGSDNWNKQGLSLKAGSDFDYLLKVTNETSANYTGLTVYDTLPANGDKDIFGGTERKSEFPVRLREAITPPEGYTVYYTTSKAVYGGSMKDMVTKDDIWASYTEISDWSDVTAFKLVANNETKLSKESPFEVRIPVCVPGKMSEESMGLLEGKEYEDQTSGTMAYLQAINSFGYTTTETTEPKQSNTVWARVPFAGFVVKKVDSLNKDVVLAGAEFELTKENDPEFRQTAVSDGNGILKFRDLTEGTYTLTEIKYPAGYIEKPVSLQVIITQNPTTMEYEVEFKDPSTGEAFAGSGTGSDPLCIGNDPLYELPSTGGIGTTWYRIGGTLLIFLAGMLILYKKKYARRCQKG